MFRWENKRRGLRERLPRASKAAANIAIKSSYTLGAMTVQVRRPELFPEESGDRTESRMPHENTHPFQYHHAHPDLQLQERQNKSEETQVASATDGDHSLFRSQVSTSKDAPPTDTPTPFNSDPSSKVTAASRKSPSMSTNGHNPSYGISTRPNVGLLKAQSPWLRKDGVCIAVFEDNSVLTFYGRVQLRVLAGVLNCSGYVLKPSSKWHELLIPVNLKQPALSLSPLSPTLIDPEFSPYLEPFRSTRGVHFHTSTSQRDGVSCSDSEGCASIDLEGRDLSQMNHLAQGQWKNVVAVILLKSLTTPFSKLLTSYLPSATHVNSQWIDGFQTVSSSMSIDVPHYYKTIGWDLAQLSGVSLLVCGPVDVGKSTLCRYLVNYLLNRWPIVCFIDLDVGQSEFTVPGVVSLHLLSEPVLGPPMTHLRRPTKAYYFGANSPFNNPDRYYRVVKGLQRHLAKVIRHARPDIPVIINTCGWVRDMGFSLLLDFIRTFNPSHIIQLLHPIPNPHDTFPQLTSNLLRFFSGLYTRPESNWGAALTMYYSTNQDEGDSRRGKTAAVDGGVDVAEREEGKKERGREGEEGEPMDEDQFLTDFESHSQEESSEEEIERRRQMTESSSSPSSEDEGEGELRDDVPLLIVGHHSHHNPGISQLCDLDTWTPLLSHRLFKTLGRSVDTCTSGRLLLRQLMMLSYFSPLLEGAEFVATEQGVSGDPCPNMMFFAPPLEIPWSDVAIHVVNSQVPRSQLLYALNGRVVALGQVHSKEIVSCEIDTPGVGIVKFLKSNDALIEFIGLGLVRAIDPAKQRYYVTTPLSLSPELLDRVNVLAIGRTDPLPHIHCNTVATVRSPYC